MPCPFDWGFWAWFKRCVYLQNIQCHVNLMILDPSIPKSIWNIGTINDEVWVWSSYFKKQWTHHQTEIQVYNSPVHIRSGNRDIFSRKRLNNHISPWLQRSSCLLDLECGRRAKISGDWGEGVREWGRGGNSATELQFVNCNLSSLVFSDDHKWCHARVTQNPCNGFGMVQKTWR